MKTRIFEDMLQASYVKEIEKKKIEEKRKEKKRKEKVNDFADIIYLYIYREGRIEVEREIFM